MVLNIADFEKSWKSLQTPWNDPKIVLKGFVTACATVCVDLRSIRKGRKLADFEQKAWAIAHGFEHGRFWQVLEIAPNSFKHRLNPWKWIWNTLRNDLCRFPVNSQRSEIRNFSIITLCYSPWFWTWRILASPGNRSKLPLTSPNCFKMHLKHDAERCASISSEFQGSEIRRFSAKTLCYSPWSWTWRILVSSGNHSKLPVTSPKSFTMAFYHVAGRFVSISSQFARVRDSPFFWKNPVL